MSEDPWDDWETAADAGLIDCDIPKVKKISTTTTTISNKQLWEKANEYSAPVIVHANNAIHTEYKPEIKVLKRPQDAKNKKESVMDKPIKPLADREKEYMEARRKIFEKYESKK
ncbi:unnamed protein product [Mucor hiemalis]